MHARANVKKLFPFGHATHPQWRMAAGLVLAQLRAQIALHDYAQQPTLAIVYITDYYAEHAQEILDHLSAELPTVPDWSGTVGVGIAANNVEYFDEPAMAVMLCELPGDQYRVFSGVAPLGVQHGFFDAHTALVHADGSTPDLGELLQELSGHMDSGYLFGGLAASRSTAVQFAVSGNGNVSGQGKASGVFQGGLSGVAFGQGVALLSRVSQGCEPLRSERVKGSAVRTITECEGNVVVQLDGAPALDVLLADLGVSLDEPRTALEKLRTVFVGLTREGDKAVTPVGNFGTDTRVRHIIGLDPARRGIAVAEKLVQGDSLVFCTRNVQAAKRDLVRICAEIREELEPAQLPMDMAMDAATEHADALPSASRHIAGAIYISCAGRGGPHFGAPSAELQLIRHALGDVPLVGFFAGGEIAHQHIYGYTGVLTVFASE
jgi:small ligand-binding sensory domain FIST